MSLNDGVIGNPVPFLALLALPAIAFRRAAYLVRGRTDWRVTVYRGKQPDYSPRRAALDEVVPGRAEANARAEELATAVLHGTFVGRGAESR